MGSYYIEMETSDGFDLTVHWDAPYGSTSAYMTWEVHSNVYGRTFNLYNRSTGARYSSGSTIPLGEYCLYVYRNGSYRTQSEWFTIAAEAPPDHFFWYFAGNYGSDPNPNYQIWPHGSTATLMGKMPNVAGTTYTVSYNANGGSSTPSSASSTQTHTHVYWNDDYGTNYNPGAKIYNVTEGNSFRGVWSSSRAPVTLAKAISRANGSTTYTVTFNANGGSCRTTSLNSTATVTFSFAGWRAGNAGIALSAGSSYTPSGNVTMYASWVANRGTYSAITLPTATRTGYDFKGWSTSSSATSGSTGSYTPTDNVTLYAIWTKKTYPVTYYANGHGTAPAAQTKTHDTALTLRAFIAQNTSTGYKVSYNANGGSSTPSTSSATTLTHTQTNWNTNSNGTGTNYRSKASYTGNAALNLYAVWSTSSNAVTLASAITKASTSETGYKVTFNANGGTCSTTELTSTKTRSYTFNKWAAGSTSGTKYSAGASYTPAGDVTMYATWTEGVTNNSINLPTPTRTGYTFKGWSTSKSATSGVTGTYTPTAATTLYATWQINTWTINYNANGHGTAPSSQTKTYGTALTLRPFISQQTATGYTVSFNKNGGTTTPSNLTSTIYYNQTYWNTKANGSGTNYSSQGSYTTNGANTMYAIWSTSNGSVTLPSAISRSQSTANGYTVTFNANGGSCSTTSLTATDTKSYTFAGWSYNGSTYTAGASFIPSEATTMTANWAISTTLGSITLPTASKSGYTFVGWGTSASATSGVTGSYTPNGNVTLYAVYSANGYQVTYNANGHGTAPANQTKTHGTALTLQSFIANQTETGYTVTLNPNEGICTVPSVTSEIEYKQTYWNTQANGSGTNYASRGTYNSDSNLTLYAIWSSTKKAVTLPTPTRNGYRFVGWSSNKNDTIGVTGSYTPQGNITLYAIWRLNNSLIHYNNNGQDILCSVYYNNNGAPVLCDVYYNNNGVAVRI